MSKQKCKTHLQDIWLENSSFKGWVLKHPTDNYMALCKVCSKDISVAAHSIKAIVRHSEGSKHLEGMPKMSQPTIITSCASSDSKTVGLAKWISKWRGHGTLKSIVGHHGWPTREFF